ncbi:MAG: hypothetical protein J7498_02995 [Sphingobium sp.]|nr:hypothetical protein [Sphingobium sp.]
MNGGQIFVLCIIAISILGGTLSMWIKARHGYPIHDRHSRRMARRAARRGEMLPDALDDGRKVQLLTSENERLAGQVSRLEERIAVLERIVTDPAERTARAIDRLAD